MDKVDERYVKAAQKQQVEKIKDLEAVIIELQRVHSECRKKLRRCRIEKRKLKNELIDEMARTNLPSPGCVVQRFDIYSCGCKYLIKNQTEAWRDRTFDVPCPECYGN